MTDQEEEQTLYFQKILVAIDTSKHSQAALEAAAALARTMEAKIQGLFVQDEVWNRISRLPSLTTVNTLTGKVTSFEEKKMEEQVELMKNRLRKKLEQVSKHHQLAHTWQSVHGKVEEKILEAASEADLITIGLKGISARRKVLGSSARRIIEEADKPVLILKEGLRLGRTITAVYDGSSESLRGVQIALNIAENNNSTLTALILNNISDEKEQYKKLENLLRGSPIFTEIQILENSNVSRLVNTLNSQKPGLLILPKNQPLLTGSLQLILRNINYPLLLMN